MEQLVAELKDSVHDAAAVFAELPDDPDASDAEFERMLTVAAGDLSRWRPLRLRHTVQLVAGVAEYQAPAGARALLRSEWGAQGARPWVYAHLHPMPKPELVQGPQSWLVFAPAPTQGQIAAFGSSYTITVSVAHQIGTAAEDTTVAEHDMPLLMLRAQAELCKELAHRGIGKPVRLRDGQTQGPRNSTPAALYRQLLQDFDRLGGGGGYAH